MQDFFYALLKNIIKNVEFYLKWYKMGPQRLRIHILGYFDTLISILIVLDSQNNVFARFLKISLYILFGISLIFPSYRALLSLRNP